MNNKINDIDIREVSRNINIKVKENLLINIGIYSFIIIIVFTIVYFFLTFFIMDERKYNAVINAVKEEKKFRRPENVKLPENAEEVLQDRRIYLNYSADMDEINWPSIRDKFYEALIKTQLYILVCIEDNDVFRLTVKDMGIPDWVCAKIFYKKGIINKDNVASYIEYWKEIDKKKAEEAKIEDAEKKK